MHSSQRYRYQAAECLRTAQAARQLRYRRLYLSMADSWLSLARRDEAIDGTSRKVIWDMDERDRAQKRDHEAQEIMSNETDGARTGS